VYIYYVHSTMKISAGRISELLRPYQVDASPALCQQIILYVDVLLQWNQKISLTTVVDPEEIVRFHFGESFWGAVVAGRPEGRLADLGSGAGFPGIALKLLIPALSIDLIESNAKKAAFLAEVCRRLGLQGVRITKTRFEDFVEAVKFSIVTSRALGSFEETLKWSETNLETGGRLLLWVNSEDAEQISRSPVFSWRPPVPIPSTKNRCIIAGDHR
jgi:16S rRNA (guanine527-N7)-methyltransferase